MVDLSEYPTKKSGLLELQGWQIDEIAEKLALTFDPDIVEHPHALDIEGLVDCHLKQKIDYIRLSPHGNILGMAVVDSQPIPMYVDGFDKAIWYVEDSNTIVIDTELGFSQDKESVYRETVGHESGHLTLQADFLRKSGDRLPAFNSVIARSKSPNPQWTDDAIAEWQATRFSAALLMPTSSVEVALLDWFNNIAHYPLNSARDLIEHIARVYQVTNETAYYRIREFKLFWYNFKDISSFADAYKYTGK